MARKSKKQSKKDDRTDGEKLIDAIKASDLARVEQLIADGADVNEMPEEETPIGVAAELGNEQIVDALLKADADPSNGGLSVPLSDAIWRGHDAIARKLLDAGAEVDGADEEGMTSLMVAARKGTLELVKLLIDRGADTKAIDSDGKSALLYAKDGSDVQEYLKPLSAAEQLKHLEPRKEPDPKDVNAPDQYGKTPLYHAAGDRDIARAKKLLAAGAKIDGADAWGQTPLMRALGNSAKDRARIQFLAESGADLHAKDEYGRTLLSQADRYLPPSGIGEEEDQKALRELFVKIGLISESAGSLTQAAGEGDLETARKLVGSGTSPDATDEQDRTPLWMAVSRGRVEVVAFLLKSGASPSKPIGRDDDADIAFGGRMMPCPKCKKPFTAMTWTRTCPACGHTFDSRKVYKQNLDEMPGLAFSWVNGWTPLMAAARMNDKKLATMLLDAGADIDAGRDDCTPLMCACVYEHLSIARLLIDRGADVNAECDEDDESTPAEIAGNAGNLELLELLWSAGAKTENQDAARLIAAARAGDVKKMQALLKAGVDINAVDPFSRNTAVYAASVHGQLEALRALLKAGASITPPKRAVAPLLMTVSAICEGLPRKTKTPADVPRYVETLKLLIEAGAKVKVSMFGFTPLDFAKQAKCKPMIELFEKALESENPKPRKGKKG